MKKVFGSETWSYCVVAYVLRNVFLGEHWKLKEQHIFIAKRQVKNSLGVKVYFHREKSNIFKIQEILSSEFKIYQKYIFTKVEFD